jgi:hypothetical protein
MIFAAETEELSLYVFDGEAEAIAHCEGLDVEAGTWVFWDDQGNPLEAQFTKPNKRGLFSAINGAYTLVPATPDHHAPLSEALEEILHFEGRAPFDSELGVREYLTGACKDGI